MRASWDKMVPIVKPLSLFLAALGLAMFLEGLPYFISPSGVRRYLEQRPGRPGRCVGDGRLHAVRLRHNHAVARRLRVNCRDEDCRNRAETAIQGKFVRSA